jgi:hypothetical protein
MYAVRVVEDLGLELAALDSMHKDGFVAARLSGQRAILVRVNVHVVQRWG